MNKNEENRFQIIFQKIDEIKSGDNDILIVSQEVAHEPETNFDTLAELSSLVKAKEEANQSQKEFFTGS